MAAETRSLTVSHTNAFAAHVVYRRESPCEALCGEALSWTLRTNDILPLCSPRITRFSKFEQVGSQY
ncbi:Hypothetical protein SMAX5B_014166 [Scophthalmus maximus]|uniref:Uncharacterized protein n=1 Tax=Scophthalmus maximus TaxID=52904 RepID=A0A2U9BHZ8_SCOMX|nr:Hypothetical protein SMAX5B_014166 [Scophthalmus maximus]KAF0035301.1 hypothetical protein F2P81_013059 [Scophthalmus maximus]